MKNGIICLLIALAACCLLATPCARADSVFDLRTMGTDVIPVTGRARPLAGAVAADPDPISAYITSPAASAFAQEVRISVGLVHFGTSSNYRDTLAAAGRQDISSATTTFPALSVTIPLHVLNLYTGYFVEKNGRAGLTVNDSAYGDIQFDAIYEKETSIFSVPIFISAAYRERFAVSGGVIFSYLDSRESRVIDFLPSGHEDADDAIDMYANGTAWALGALLDYDFVRVGGSVRTGYEMSGSEELSSDIAGQWHSSGVTVKSPSSFKVGAALVARTLTVEFDYERSPWSKLRLNGEYLSVNTITRYALGITYRGRHLWNAVKYPLLVGVYTQPLDRRSDRVAETTETGYSAGTAFAIAGGRASIGLGLEYLRRDRDGDSDLRERAFGFHISISVHEAWRREIKR